MKKIKIIGIIIIITCSLLIINQVISKNINKNVIKQKVNSYKSNPDKDMFGILEIPKLKINNVIYNYGTIQNNVNKNVYLVEKSKNFQIILAAHSGESNISYFKNLDLLSKKNIIKFTKNNIVREYKLFNKEEVNKVGTIAIKKYSYPTLVLITCSKRNKNIQEVYYTRLTKSYKIT